MIGNSLVFHKSDKKKTNKQTEREIESAYRLLIDSNRMREREREKKKMSTKTLWEQHYYI